jgi:hypothetical protein
MAKPFICISLTSRVWSYFQFLYHGYSPATATSHQPLLGGTFSWFLWLCIFTVQHKLLKMQPSFAASVLAVAHREEKCVFGGEAGFAAHCIDHRTLNWVQIRFWSIDKWTLSTDTRATIMRADEMSWTTKSVGFVVSNVRG